MKNKYPVRYPVGYNNMQKCLFAVKDNDPDRKLDYIEARKEIYIPLYCQLVKENNKFLELKERLNNGENLLIIEVDGPHQESLQYYIDNYYADNDFIENDTMIATEENLSIMMHDPKHPFDHGYCLAVALLDMEYLTNLF